MKLTTGGLLAAMAMTLVGCAMTPVPPVDRRVTLAPELSGKIMVTDIRCTKGAGEFLTVQANVVNNDDDPYPVQWKVQWLDGEGVEIESSAGSWDAVMLQPFEVRGLKGTAPRTDAADMRLYFRRGR